MFIQERHAVSALRRPPRTHEAPTSAEGTAFIWKSRLSSLDDEKQSAIARKYYGGHKPWRD